MALPTDIRAMPSPRTSLLKIISMNPPSITLFMKEPITSNEPDWCPEEFFYHWNRVCEFHLNHCNLPDYTEGSANWNLQANFKIYLKRWKRSD